ncbi:hypothetical protein [Mesobacillus subterraneus]|uniref:hypothetical protein n=1 Tax=Mesobacillus subterraneus TaxID=285983 RepID=UPI0014757E53|nr:hypothetical protein [Mesobacillus subterraneus]
MQGNEQKLDLERLKNDPSLEEVLKLTQSLFSNLPDTKSVQSTQKTPVQNDLNKEAVDSLLKTAKTIVNPTTLSLLSNSFNQAGTTKTIEKPTSFSKQKVELLEDDLNRVKRELIETQSLLAETNQHLKELETEIAFLKRRRRR